MTNNGDGLRRCRDCGEWKPLLEFCRNTHRPDGRGSYCKPCFNLRSKASYAKRIGETSGRPVRPSRNVPAGHRYCPDCRETKAFDEFPRNRSDSTGYASYCKPCHNVRGREGKARIYGSTREYHLRRRYGFGQEQFDRMLAAQGGVCGICGAPDPRHVDHDHAFGNVRGILCFNCNGGLGHFKDDLDRLTKAISYLRGTTWQRVSIHPGVYRLYSPRRGPRRLPSS
jgi:recombination endonuclease VII